jgi:hypothetical protein
LSKIETAVSNPSMPFAITAFNICSTEHVNENETRF